MGMKVSAVPVSGWASTSAVGAPTSQHHLHDVPSGNETADARGQVGASPGRWSTWQLGGLKAHGAEHEPRLVPARLATEQQHQHQQARHHRVEDESQVCPGVVVHGHDQQDPATASAATAAAPSRARPPGVGVRGRSDGDHPQQGQGRAATRVSRSYREGDVRPTTASPCGADPRAWSCPAPPGARARAPPSSGGGPRRTPRGPFDHGGRRRPAVTAVLHQDGEDDLGLVGGREPANQAWSRSL